MQHQRYYKFRPNIKINDRFRDIETLLNDGIYASAFANLNDPFEATYDDLIQNTLGLIEKTFKVSADDVRDKWNALQDKMSKLGIVSFVQTAGIPDHELMWSFYANSHKGFCIEYDLEKLKLSEPLRLNVNQISVRYSHTPPKVTVNDIKSLNSMITKLFATKSKRWKYENEVRLIYDSIGIKTYYPQALKAVFFGCKMESDLKEQMMSGLSGKDVSFYQMERIPGTYRLQATLVRQNSRNYPIYFPETDYKLLFNDKNNFVENFHIYYKGPDKDESRLLEFVKWYRFKFATKDKSNVFLYDSASIKHLINKYPLSDKENLKLEKHIIAESFFSSPDQVFIHPHQ